PRARGVLTRTKLARLAKRFGFSYSDFDAPPDALLERALAALEASPALAVVRAGRGPIEERFDALAGEAGREDATIGDMTRQAAARVRDEFDRIERAAARRDETRVETVRNQVERLCDALAPWRKPQERVYTVFSFLFEQGWGLIPRLIDELDIESFTLNEVEL
ncbi:MAG: bacillithiol biosynthesis BshC, partial [Candidatus Hydrogenedentes bacterium]|nr:bacillithiol biosynthesis BshC [Candidatus Hydrogenedentota bacterium]